MPDETVTEPIQAVPLAEPTAVSGIEPISAPTSTPAAEHVTPDSYVNADGTLKDGWRESIVPEDFRGRPCYNAVGNDIQSLLKHIGNQDIAISKQGKGIFVPGPNATQTEKDIYYKAIGRPDSKDDYTFTVPDDLKQYYADETLINEAKDAFHKVGMNKEQFTTVMALDAMRFEQSQKEMIENPMPFYEEIMPHVLPILQQQAVDSLKTKWGDAYESRLHYANMAIEASTVEGQERDTLVGKYGNDPVFADFAATMYLKSHTESNGVDTSLGRGSSSMNLDQRIAEIMSDPNYMDERTNPTRHKQLVGEIMSLRKQKNPGNVGQTS